MRRILFILSLCAFAQAPARTEIDQKESLQIVGLNQAEMDAYKAAMEAQMKYQAAEAYAKSIIETMRVVHHDVVEMIRIYRSLEVWKL
jgi:hypothetical protein